jgi:hypothetical protein
LPAQLAALDALLAKDLVRLNALLKERGLPAVVAGARAAVSE